MKPTHEVSDLMYRSGFRAPTVLEGESISQKKYDFIEVFDRLPFCGILNSYIYDRFMRKKKN